MKLLTENYLAESKKEGKHWMIEGVFMQAAVKNRNGRVYPESTMANEAKKYIKEYVDQNRACGELGHPASPSINLDRVSHLVTGLTRIRITGLEEQRFSIHQWEMSLRVYLRLE